MIFFFNFSKEYETLLQAICARVNVLNGFHNIFQFLMPDEISEYILGRFKILCLQKCFLNVLQRINHAF